ncbi:MAG TPA: Asp-tRNA(Asn)/Glu-tRNA(Gln) amidotransferase subunit GatC [Polyangiaceae bacterium]|jgi:aspartyl-tRNA(Asn)/glutamyl-tRNA(Gln) amidotransferase subunit C|nr:Asp-tRNA(Asn)/Glu-tRNA(Gln) amidotransferase subunit GatC [Polyangiaceae bacterium]
MALTKDHVRHVAALARIELTEAEVEHFTQDLGNILEHVEQLAGLATDHVEPTRYLAVNALPLEQDAVSPSLPHDLALAPAPRVLSGGFAVPAFVDEG